VNRWGRELAVKISELVVRDKEELGRIVQARNEFAKIDAGFGYDVFGAEYESALLAYCLMRFFYDWYFRVDSYGHENVPPSGPLILAANHSGIVPLDGAMIAIDLFRKFDPPRIVRAVIEKLFTKFPYSKDLMSRVGQVIGLKRNFNELLKSEQGVLVFPEGARGMGKPFSRRYRLTRFNVGHVELSISNKAPIVPVAVIGGEEQAPILFNWKRIGKLIDINAFPITLTWPWLGPIGLWPLPTKYYIYYGKPFRFWEEDPEALSKSEVIRDMADRVQASVQEMLDKGVEIRPSIFFRN